MPVENALAIYVVLGLLAGTVVVAIAHWWRG